MDNTINTTNEKNRILIVDDDRSNIVALHHIMKADYTILSAISGKAAIGVAKEARPDLILLDIIMPDMSGFEVLTELKREDVLRKIPVIFITALDNTEDEAKGFTLGAVDYIKKPFNDTIVKARVNTHLKMAEYVREIERYGVTDKLTGLLNRRGFDERAAVEWSRATRRQEPLSVLMIDADNFKLYNDKHGHMQGDILLRTIATIFSNNAKRAEDIAARWGGEEFVALLPNTGIDMAVAIAERMRAEVEVADIPHPGGTPPGTTVSIGVHSEIPMIGGKMEDFFVKADNMLYKAKKSGKNRVCSELP